MYNVRDVGRYVVSFLNQQEVEITNLKLQKLLYFLWIDFYKKTNRRLFEEEMVAWPLGPVSPSSYADFSAYGNRQIKSHSNIILNAQDKEIIHEFLNNYKDISASRLVDISHENKKPWDLTYENGQGKGKVIPFDLIIDLECRGKTLE